jgi:hypothetical protein
MSGYSLIEIACGSIAPVSDIGGKIMPAFLITIIHAMTPFYKTAAATCSGRS